MKEKKKKKNLGRPCKYETHVKPRLAEIQSWCQTMTERQMAKACGVSHESWCQYKKKYTDLTDALKRGRLELVADLRSTLLKRASGFNYQETKEIIENGVVVRTERYTKAALPDVASLNLALKNYDPDRWANDPQMLAIRKQELKLQEMKFEEMKW